jgi:hypothetical protein
MNTTKHAAIRMQQRAIPPIMVDLLYLYGREHPTTSGTVVFLDARARERAREALADALSRFDKLADAYLVEAAEDGAVVTVGHRNAHLRRK